MLRKFGPAAIGLLFLGASATALSAAEQQTAALSAAEQQTAASNKAGVDFRHTINMADRERLLSQKLSKELLLVALGYNKKENLRNIQYDHDTFARILKGLHYGDVELALQPTEDGEVLDRLSRVEELWPLFESALRDSIKSGHVLRDHVEIVADLSLPLLTAMDEAVQSYEDWDARITPTFSLLDHVVNLAGRQRMLSQKMATEFLLIAYGHSVKINRARLKGTIKQFDRVMTGLMTGDGQLRLLPPPNQRIMAQLRSVQRLWADYRPLLETAMKGKKVSEDHLAHMASLSGSLLSEMDAAVNMYETL